MQNPTSHIRFPLLALGIFLATFLGVVSGFIYYGVQQNAANLQSPVSSERMNILLAGVDYAHGCTDAILLVSLSPDANSIKILSVPASAKTTVAGGDIKLGAVYSVGGADMLIEKVTELVPIPVHHYIAADISCFQKIVDLLGGVEFDVPYDMYYQDPSQGLLIDLKKGVQRLDGEAAQQLVRYTESFTASDGRDNVQLAFLEAAILQKRDSLALLPEVLNELSKNANTDFAIYDAASYTEYAKLFFHADIFSRRLSGTYEYVGDTLFFIADDNDALPFLLQ